MTIYHIIAIINRGIKRNMCFAILLCGFSSCNKIPDNVAFAQNFPVMSPDYENISIPVNIAPLNFSMKVEKISVALGSKGGSIVVRGKDKVFFPKRRFKNLLQKSVGDTIWVTVSSRVDKKWTTYKPFFWKVEAEPVDSFLTYRLIEPGYEVWNKVAIAQRNVTDFSETHIADNNLLENRNCMNCHIPNKHKPSQSFFHIRGKNGMTVVSDNESMRFINTKLKGAYSNLTYGNWAPSGNHIAFSTNVVLPSTHTIHDKRAFVYDTLSDVMVLDLRRNEVLRSGLFTKENVLETFPEFSADGKILYYCSAPKVDLPEEHKKLLYNICAIGFDEATNTFDTKVDTLFNAREKQKTASGLKVSPDGKFLAFCCFSYGTFALWHNDAKIYLYNFGTGGINTLPQLNNNANFANSYHSWSSNSRWLAFASKRDNGLYSKIYFSYIDKNGHATKPFVLPQKDPDYYDFQFKSYNVPELMRNKVPFNAFDIVKACKEEIPETLHYSKIK